MPRVGVYDQLRKVLQDVVAPDLHAIRGDLRLLDEKIDGVDARLTTKIDALDEKIDGVDARLTTKVDALDDRLTTRMDSLRTELVGELRRLDVRIDGVDREMRIAIDIRERLAALEARRVS